MAQVIVMANQKGGVAKTTSTYNIASALANKGKKVLMIDMDPQASLTIYAGLEPYDQPLSIVDVMKNPKMDLSDAIVSLRMGLDMVCSRIELAGLEAELLGRPARELALRTALGQVQEKYDYICVDCPPQLSTLTLNAIAAATKIIIPCKTDYLAYRGLKQLTETIETIKEYFNPSVEIVGLLATMYESRAKDDREILEVLKEEYHVIGIIKRTAQAKKGMYDGLSSVDFAPKSELAQEYEKVADLIL